jgi:3-oxoacyl-[acyl-carrier protein] reductase
MTTKSVAFVAGASQGIGQATALRLTCDFSAVVLVARSKNNLDKTASAVKSAGTEGIADLLAYLSYLLWRSG